DAWTTGSLATAGIPWIMRHPDGPSAQYGLARYRPWTGRIDPIDDPVIRLGQHFADGLHIADMSAQTFIVFELHAELDWGDNRRGRHITKGIVRHAHDVDHHRDAPAGPDIGGRSTASHVDQCFLDGICQPDGVLGDTCPQGPSGAAQEQDTGQGWLTVFTDTVNCLLQWFWHGLALRLQSIVKLEVLGMLTGRGRDQQAQARFRHLGVKALDDGKRIGNIGTAPAITRIGDQEIAPRGGFTALHLDARRRNVQTAPRLVLGKDASDVIIYHHDFVSVPKPLLRKDSDGRRAAANTHAFFFDAIHNGSLAGLHHQLRTTINA